MPRSTPPRAVGDHGVDDEGEAGEVGDDDRRPVREGEPHADTPRATLTTTEAMTLLPTTTSL